MGAHGVDVSVEHRETGRVQLFELGRLWEGQVREVGRGVPELCSGHTGF